MRSIQIIDSLEPGGAERMAVNYANALAQKITFSGLVVTRKEGALRNHIQDCVSYLFLDKKRTLDLGALLKLKKFIKSNNVTLVHAHGTSYFIAVLLKIIHPKITIIWHDHYGARINETRLTNWILVLSSMFFSGIFVVNLALKVWAKKELLTKDVFYIPNFAVPDDTFFNTTILKGQDNKRIVCVANLKEPKNHICILIAFKELKLRELGWSLHLIGKDYKDNYSGILKAYISKYNLKEAIFIYDSQNDIQHVLSQATIGILASTDEGFPVALIEYGLAKLAVICTHVGHCSLLIQEGVTGLLFDPLDPKQLQKQLLKLIGDSKTRTAYGLHLQQLVHKEYSQEKVIAIVLDTYKMLKK